jgi:hypothetical protein
MVPLQELASKMVLWELGPAPVMKIFSRRNSIMAQMKYPYTHKTLMEAHKLPNSDPFAIISKCF